jgi:Zn-dependent M16 (insulinase) family peptidase
MSEIKPTRKTIKILYDKNGNEESMESTIYGMVEGVETVIGTENIGFNYTGYTTEDRTDDEIITEHYAVKEFVDLDISQVVKSVVVDYKREVSPSPPDQYIEPDENFRA